MREKGELSYRIFNDCDDAPSSNTLRRLDFGALCQKAGFKLPKETIARLKGSRLVRRLRKKVMDKIQRQFPERVSQLGRSEARFLIDNSTVVSLRLCRFVRYVKGEPRWNRPPVLSKKSNATLLALMNPSNTVVEQFIAIPRAKMPAVRRLGLQSSCMNRGTRFGKIDDLCEIIRSLERSEWPRNGAVEELAAPVIIEGQRVDSGAKG